MRVLGQAPLDAADTNNKSSGIKMKNEVLCSHMLHFDIICHVPFYLTIPMLTHVAYCTYS